MIGVLCRRRRPSCRLASLVRYNAQSTGSAQGREQKGNWTLIASTTHRCPQIQTLCVRVERSGSRWRPLP